MSMTRKFLRPPGAISEEEFLRKCIKCGKCVEACEKYGSGCLELLSIFKGLRYWRTPTFNPFKAPCEILGKCSVRQYCIEACPTGALVKRHSYKLGKVIWNPNKCIKVRGGECLVCIEVCPMNAIRFVNKVLQVRDSICRGCGKCVHACPGRALTLIPC